MGWWIGIFWDKLDLVFQNFQHMSDEMQKQQINCNLSVNKPQVEAPNTFLNNLDEMLSV